MRQVILLASLVLFIFQACKEPEKLSKQEEEAWLDFVEDMYVAKAAAQRLFGSERDSLEEVYFMEIYQKHGKDSTSLDSFMNRMIQDMMLEEFYQKLNDRLQILEDSIIIEQDNQ